MEKLLYFVIHLGVPVLILLAAFANRTRSRAGFFLGMLFQVACLLFLYLWGQYPMVGSYYLRYLILGIIGLVLLQGWRKYDRALTLLPKTWKSWTINVLLILSVPILLFMNYNLISGLFSRIEPGADLDFPLKKGTYYVSSGGTTAIANNHYRNYPNSQQYAIDINQIDRFGRVSNNVLSQTSSGHVIFGQAVYSPCSGIILEIRNNVPDNEKTSMQVAHDFGRGNYVDLDCKGLIVSMSHFKKGSVAVKEGEEVKKGQLLARVGNSGFSQEPHLHLQGARYAPDSTLIGVPVTFDGQWLVRNALVVKE